MTITGIDTVAVVVADRRAAIAWDRDVLGLEGAYIGPMDAAPDGRGTAQGPGPGWQRPAGGPGPLDRARTCAAAEPRASLRPRRCDGARADGDYVPDLGHLCGPRTARRPRGPLPLRAHPPAVGGGALHLRRPPRERVLPQAA